jgi:hypothetical protein
MFWYNCSIKDPWLLDAFLGLFFPLGDLSCMNPHLIGDFVDGLSPL